ncbi:MAG: 30S ribosomal protein S9 [Verrucomicrobia bacterium]|nr:30S ribosomal protein S9 [Verrucomicrobiota bacterium]
MSTATLATATGRRKNAVARVQLRSGSGKITVNNRPMDEYFPTLVLQNKLLEPLQIAQASKQYDIDVKAHGGGVTGQVGAITLGISRALTDIDAELRPPLKVKGLLKRDSRMKERKKAGQPGARKRFQFSKR